MNPPQKEIRPSFEPQRVKCQPKLKCTPLPHTHLILDLLETGNVKCARGKPCDRWRLGTDLSAQTPGIELFTDGHWIMSRSNPTPFRDPDSHGPQIAVFAFDNRRTFVNQDLCARQLASYLRLRFPQSCSRCSRKGLFISRA